MSEQKSFVPFVPVGTQMKEFTFRAVFLGILMAMLMGAANAYLGLKAGMTIAATYTTAVLGMAILKAMRGTILEENASRTIGSIGGNIATGAIFTLPAFFIASVWDPFYSTQHYIISTIILAFAGVLGIVFTTFLRRVLVGDTELPFPESVAAAEIHKSGQGKSGGSGLLLAGMGIGAFFTALVEFRFIAATWQKVVSFSKGAILLRSPGMAPAYFGVGYIIGPKLGAINFSGGLLAWGLLAPIIAYFLHYNDAATVGDWGVEIVRVWKAYVRYIAIGGMLVGSFYTLYKMRKSLFDGIGKSFANLKKTGGQGTVLLRTDKDINVRWAMLLLGAIMVVMFFIFNYFANDIVAALVATFVMVIMGFVFSAVSGYLVGIIGVSNNPTSGLTVSVLIIVALLMVLLGLRGQAGLAAVLGVAAFTCTSVSVAGEMMQDLKAGQILGCTPWRMQLGDIFGVIASAAVMFLVLTLLHIGDIKKSVETRFDKLEKEGITTVVYQGKKAELSGKTYTISDVKAMQPEQQNDVLGTNAGFGGERLPAPQASLMAVVAKGIVDMKMELILIVVGIFMGIAMILMQVKSPMLISVGMYLPIDTSFAIFLGGAMRGIVDYYMKKRGYDEATREKLGNKGVLLASGLIAGEALIGLLFAAMAFAEVKMFEVFETPSFIWSTLAILFIGFVLVRFTIGKKPVK